MKKSMYLGTFVLTALVWAGAQQTGNPSSQPGSMSGQAGAPTTSPGSGQMPSSATPGAPGQNSPQATPQSGAAGVSGPITEGCLGGSSPNFTITDTAGKTYKLNLPPNADGSRLTPHIGESVQVAGQVSQTGGSNSISVSQIGKGSGTCPGK